MKKLGIDQVVVKPRTESEKLENVARASADERTSEARLPSLIVGRIAAIQESGMLLVDFPGNTSGKLVSAQTLVSLTAKDAGREIALMFENGDPAVPIIVGLFQTLPTAPQREIKLDDETIVLSAKKEVVIQCGKSSITLTSAGKVLIRGAYLLSRSSGVNRIKGGSVQIN